MLNDVYNILHTIRNVGKTLRENKDNLNIKGRDGNENQRKNQLVERLPMRFAKGISLDRFVKNVAIQNRKLITMIIQNP